MRVLGGISTISSRGRKHASNTALLQEMFHLQRPSFGVSACFVRPVQPCAFVPLVILLEQVDFARRAPLRGNTQPLVRLDIVLVPFTRKMLSPIFQTFVLPLAHGATHVMHRSFRVRRFRMLLPLQKRERRFARYTLHARRHRRHDMLVRSTVHLPMRGKQFDSTGIAKFRSYLTPKSLHRLQVRLFSEMILPLLNRSAHCLASRTADTMRNRPAMPAFMFRPQTHREFLHTYTTVHLRYRNRRVQVMLR